MGTVCHVMFFFSPRITAKVDSCFWTIFVEKKLAQELDAQLAILLYHRYP